MKPNLHLSAQPENVECIECSFLSINDFDCSENMIDLTPVVKSLTRSLDHFSVPVEKRPKFITDPTVSHGTEDLIDSMCEAVVTTIALWGKPRDAEGNRINDGFCVYRFDSDCGVDFYDLDEVMENEEQDDEMFYSPDDDIVTVEFEENSYHKAIAKRDMFNDYFSNSIEHETSIEDFIAYMGDEFGIKPETASALWYRFWETDAMERFHMDDFMDMLFEAMHDSEEA